MVFVSCALPAVKMFSAVPSQVNIIFMMGGQYRLFGTPSAFSGFALQYQYILIKYHHIFIMITLSCFCHIVGHLSIIHPLW